MAFELFPYQDKIILNNKPEDGLSSQYNYYNGEYSGIDGDYELYTLTNPVDQNFINIYSYPGEYYSSAAGTTIKPVTADGLLWPYQESSIEVQILSIYGTNQESW